MTEDIAESMEKLGMSHREISSLREAIATAEVFWRAKETVDRLRPSISMGHEQTVDAVGDIIKGLGGWHGDKAVEVKRDLRNWMKRKKPK